LDSLGAVIAEYKLTEAVNTADDIQQACQALIKRLADAKIAAKMESAMVTCTASAIKDATPLESRDTLLPAGRFTSGGQGVWTKSSEPSNWQGGKTFPHQVVAVQGESNRLLDPAQSLFSADETLSLFLEPALSESSGELETSRDMEGPPAEDGEAPATRRLPPRPPVPEKGNLIQLSS